jgi:hypothetical protein
MDPSNLLSCESPQALVAWLLQWGTGCGQCNHLPRPDRLLCSRCDGRAAYPPLSERRLRLIACAFCRVVWRHLDDKARQAVRVAERFAEGQASVPELNSAYVFTLCNVAAQAVLRCGSEAARHAAQRATELCAAVGPALGERELCDAVRDLIGDPFRPAVIDPRWLDGNGGQALAVAACIDLEGNFDEMPILADALEEAGCSDERLLSHARQARHYRGCFLLDAVLGRS